jgi:hypothetical protein
LLSLAEEKPELLLPLCWLLTAQLWCVGAGGALTDKELLAKLSENEALMKEMELSWEEKLKASPSTLLSCGGYLLLLNL